MNLSQWEKSLLEYYLYNHKAKWMRVYNKSCVLYNIQKKDKKAAILW